MKTPEIKQEIKQETKPETTWNIEKTADGYHWFKTIRTKGGKK